MNEIRNILSHYFQILEENNEAKFLRCKNAPLSFDKKKSINELWKIHDQVINNFKVSDIKPKTSILNLKMEIASRIFRNCCFCERCCGVDRTEKSGNCGVKKTLISSEFLHMGEESVLIPSHTIFFSGCTFHCVFCQNWDISQSNCGTYIDPTDLKRIIMKRANQGAKNVNWVGGDPTPDIYYILQVLELLDVNIPQVWNSNMYCSIESMKLLNGVIDLYLTDFKYGNDKCAKRLSKVDNYLEIVLRNHRIAYDNGEMIIRHLVMPNHIECCSKPIMRYISNNFPDAAVNIMSQYRPEYHADEYDDISRFISNDEYFSVRDFARELGIHLI